VNRLLLLVCLVAAGCRGTSQWATSVPQQRTGGTDQLACTPSGRDPHRVGVVVLPAGHTFNLIDTRHGGSSPGESIARLADVLERAGFRVVLPEMPWSMTHPYDRSFEEALDAVAGADANLRAQGAERVVVVGHSLGGAAAIGFGAVRGGVDGIVALAASPDPGSLVQERDRADSVAKAEAMVAAGQANEMAAFKDINMQYQGVVRTTAAHYLSFYSPEGKMSLHRNLADWPPGLPLLWIDGSDEARRQGRERMVRSRLRPEPLTRYLVVSAGHAGVADAAADLVVAWIGCL
jgi:pimeloyl-ACP methyl ester carboxylesterase